jgi:hypothetical protein
MTALFCLSLVVWNSTVNSSRRFGLLGNIYLLHALHSHVEALLNASHLVDLFAHLLDLLLFKLCFPFQVVARLLEAVQVGVHLQHLVDPLLVLQLLRVVVVVATDDGGEVIVLDELIH